MNKHRLATLTVQLLAGCGFCMAASTLHSADYYVDPATGSMSNPGTSSSPWSTLEAVFAANKTFAAGDTIHLRNGHHGLPTIRGHHTATVTIKPQTGHTPTLRRLNFNNASRWVVSGLIISPETAGVIDKNTLVSIHSTCSYITVQQCNIYSASSIVGWVETDWFTKVASGVATSGTYTTFADNQISNVAYAIAVNRQAEHSLVTRNVVTNFSHDGIRGIADNCVYEYNTVRNCFGLDDHHDDGFQSWSGGSGGVPVGTSVVKNVVLRGNAFISFTDPNQPFKANMQGIGCFDGYYENWVVENNLVVTDMWHGIAFFGAINCRIVNNTVMKNPINAHNMRPWLKIRAHKNGGASTGNICRNNLVWDLTNEGSIGTVDHNIVNKQPTLQFVNYNAFDFSLKAGSIAIDAGSDVQAPLTDIDGLPRSSPVDVGAYEYQSGAIAYEGFNYAPTATISAAADSLTDYGWLGTTWSSNNDVINSGLAYSTLAVEGNAVRYGSNVSATRHLDPAEMPDDHAVTGADSVKRLGKTGSTVWISFLIKPEAEDPTGSLLSGLELIGITTGGGVKLQIGDIGPQTNWGIKSGSSFAQSSSPITVGQTVFLVAKIEFVDGINNDRVELFVNPPLSSTAPATPSAILTGKDIGSFHAVQFKGNRTSVGDELTIGTDWKSVVGF